MPPVVAGVRPLDLHDLRAERGEDLGAVRPGDRGRDVDDANAGEREEGHRRNHRRSARMRACRAGSTSGRSPTGSPGTAGATSIIFVVAVVDAFFPLVPSETTLVIGGTFAASGDLSLLLVILAGAAGAVVGDNISYGIGTLRRRAHRQAMVLAARRPTSGSNGPSERSTSAARTSSSSPASSRAARTAVTFSAGYVHSLPWRRFIVYDVDRGARLGNVRGAARLLRRQDVRGPPALGRRPRSRDRVVARARRRGGQALPAAPEACLIPSFRAAHCA